MPHYDFASLSSTDFEYLMCDVWNTAEGLGLQCFPEGRDRGIDAREVRGDGWTVIGQCKHFQRSSKSALLREVEKETHKHGYQVADRYLFATTYPATAAVIDEIASKLDIPVSDVWGPDRINQALADHPRIEANHFKLWFKSTTVLKHILHAGIHNRTKALLERIPDETRFWVDTPELPVARELLQREGVCVLTGAPGVGKTCLAGRLVLESLHDGWGVICVSDSPRDAWDLCDKGVKQLFYFDDFLGEVSLADSAVQQAPDLRNFIAHVRNNHADKRLVMTSRQQIVQHAGYAKSDALKDLVQDPFFCAITMDDLDVATKIDMLTAHLTLSNLSDAERELARTDRRTARLAVHHSYAPRLIRTVVDRLDCSSTADEAFDALAETFANPIRVWQTSYESVSAHAQSILRTLATLMPRPVELRRLRGLARFEGTAPEWKSALKEIEPAWIRIVDADTEKAAVFSNPSCRDYLLGLLDDEDYAEECLAQLDCLEQLVNLAQESGVITIPRVSVALPERKNLAGTIRRYSAPLVSEVTSWMADIASEHATVAEILNSLRDAARITSALGTPDSFGWLIDCIRDLLDSHANILPTHESLALASHLHDTGAAGLLAAVAEDLIEAGLRGAGTSRDLWSYEALREETRTAGLELVANQTAQRIFDMEWEVLLAQPGEINKKISEGEALHAQAQWYGIELNLGDLIDDTP
ncbi:restriction endonuclease [Nocardia neocaledoniensis]|uniref:nSTAND3 domain-containing NTPase n=1 Tax=Nocardia neocaledoniensis TaxID=236511 RepID=UPI00245875EE|nr:restriction endonuclease [Nocardia neocaledoniensis]